MISLKVNSKPHELPTSWDDLKFWQYREILRATPETTNEQLLAKFLKIDYAMFQDSVLVGFEPVLIALQFMAKPPSHWNQANPSKIGNYILPADITLETVIQYEHMKKLAFQKKPFIELVDDYPMIVAIYAQKIRDGKYDYQKARQMSAELEEYNAREIIEAANFFLAKLLTLNSISNPNYQNGRQTQRKKSFLRSWLASASKAFSTMWQSVRAFLKRK